MQDTGWEYLRRARCLNHAHLVKQRRANVRKHRAAELHTMEVENKKHRERINANMDAVWKLLRSADQADMDDIIVKLLNSRFNRFRKQRIAQKSRRIYWFMHFAYANLPVVAAWMRRIVLSLLIQVVSSNVRHTPMTKEPTYILIWFVEYL